MDKIKELIESLQIDGVDAAKMAKEFDTVIQEARQQDLDEHKAKLDNEFELKLAEAVAKAHDKAEELAQAKLEEHKAELEEWHTTILNEEVKALDNQLKIAADVRSVRSGLEKIMEGLKEAGLDLSQLHESAVASQIAKLEEEKESLQTLLDLQETETKRFQRAFIVSEATRGLTDVARDSVVKSADALDESIETPRFQELVKILVADKPLAEATAKTVKEEVEKPLQESKVDKTAADKGLSTQETFRRMSRFTF